MKKEKIIYAHPEASEIYFSMEETMCVSGNFRFGNDKASGVIEDSDIVDGGSF